MIDCEQFTSLLIENEIHFFSGIPDTILKSFCDCLMERFPRDRHLVAANEGNAIALVAGYHLATGKAGLVYMQNSGLGNAINPLASLVHEEIYGIPLLLMIGWRGEPGIGDEPQHLKQGKITLDMLEMLDIPFEVLPKDIGGASRLLKKAVAFMTGKSAPFALIVRGQTFKPYETPREKRPWYKLTREKAIRLIVSDVGSQDIVITTTGKTSRELFELREERGQTHDQDLLMVGSMGHASQIALAVALAIPGRDVYCLDGDGALIMHMGALAVIGSKSPKNFKHIVLNNGSHDSVGGQPTAGFEIDIPRIAKSCGYKAARRTSTLEGLREKLRLLKNEEGPALLEIRINKGARKDLGRPTHSPLENKISFMDFLKYSSS